MRLRNINGTIGRGAVNLKGQNFGRLTVLSSTGRYQNGRLIWHCICTCGNTKDVNALYLTSGGTKSCGCLYKETVQRLANSRIGKRSNYWKHGKSGTPIYERELKLKSNYGMSLNQYDLLLKKQNSKCAICKKSFKVVGTLCVDHDHKTGEVRGLLCRKCNSILGLAKDSLVIFNNAIKYFKK